MKWTHKSIDWINIFLTSWSCLREMHYITHLIKRKNVNRWPFNYEFRHIHIQCVTHFDLKDTQDTEKLQIKRKMKKRSIFFNFYLPISSHCINRAHIYLDTMTYILHSLPAHSIIPWNYFEVRFLHNFQSTDRYWFITCHRI